MVESYDKQHRKVNQRYRELSQLNEKDPIDILKKEFELSVSIVWDYLGIKDEFEIYD